MNSPDRSFARRIFEMLEVPQGQGFCLIWQGARLDGATLRAAAQRTARLMHRHGLRRGDCVALWLPNGPQWLVVALATSRLGLTLVSLNPRFGRAEVGDLIQRTAAKALVIAHGHRDGYCVDVLRAVEPRQRAALNLIIATESTPGEILPGVPQCALSDAEREDETPIGPGEPEDRYLILATTGTTSAPKLVQHAQNRISRHAAEIGSALDLFAPGTAILLGLPTCGAFGFTVCMAALCAGATLVLMETFDPAEAVRLAQIHRVTHMMGTDDMLDKMLSATDAARPLPALRMYCHANFTPSLRDFPQRVEARGITLRGAYGMSEMLATVAAQPLDAPLAQRALGGGRLNCPDAEFRIRDVATGALIDDDRLGEIEIRTPNVMLGYLDDPAATAKAFTGDGFLRTGDSGYRLPDGCFAFVSRINDVLRIGGYLVGPAEIEDVIRRDGGVAICQVVAVERPEGMRPVAFVVLNAGAAFDEAKLLADCRAALAIYKVPVRIFALPAMPTADGPNGAKVRKTELRDMAAQLLANRESSP